MAKLFRDLPAPGRWDLIGGSFRENYQSFGTPFHGGVDLNLNFEQVHAPGAALVEAVHTESERAWDFGNWIVLDHPGTPYYSAYAHLSRINVRAGQEVFPGDLLGVSGNSGKGTGAHLHWAVSINPWFALKFDELSNPLAHMDIRPVEAPMDEELIKKYAVEAVRQWLEDGKSPTTELPEFIKAMTNRLKALGEGFGAAIPMGPHATTDFVHDVAKAFDHARAVLDLNADYMNLPAVDR